jgi:hypothetical protein
LTFSRKTNFGIFREIIKLDKKTVGNRSEFP